MRRIFAVVLLLVIILPAVVSCTEQGDNSDYSSSSEVSDMTVADTNASGFWSDAYADPASGIASASDVYSLGVYADGISLGSVSEAEGTDMRFLFRGTDYTRVAVLPEGYCVTLPGYVEADYNLGAIRSRYKGDGYRLTVTYENQNPYNKDSNGNNSVEGWNIYIDEWLTENIASVDYLAANNLRRTRQVFTSTELCEGYEVTVYSITINLPLDTEYPYYNIAIVRPVNTYNYFFFFNLKSAENMDKAFDAIIASFCEIERKGEPVSAQRAFECRIPDSWNAETKAYYEKLCSQDYVDWGAFYAGNDPEYIEWLQGEEALDYDMDVFMTYLHMGYYDTEITYDNSVKERNLTYAGGNGFDDKAVLMLSYQWTTTNNACNGYTPMFDILRGKMDDEFEALAKSIKEYGKPVLFRISNEMNTDWTDYCGMMTLCDPDIFAMCWERMYSVFEEQGVDNCIWVFNPVAVTCPYSNWGEYLCYLPDIDCVQMLGLTSYEAGNGTALNSFENLYTYVYNEYMPYFEDYPWCIGEFAAGCGGEIQFNWGTMSYDTTVAGRNASLQADWIKGMFKNIADRKEFCSRIKVAVWFSANDYALYGEEYKVTNYFMLDETAAEGIEEFRKGLAAQRRD